MLTYASAKVETTAAFHSRSLPVDKRRLVTRFRVGTPAETTALKDIIFITTSANEILFSSALVGQSVCLLARLRKKND